MRVGGIGGGVGVVLLIAYMLLGGNPLDLIPVEGDPGSGPQAVDTRSEGAPPADAAGAYLSSILRMTEDVWSEIFAQNGVEYREPTLVLFSRGVRSACGVTSSAVGPFYCPVDQKLYLDTRFFDRLSRMGGEGDFAQAYVVGHEVGHHVQTLVGTSDWVRSLQASSDDQGARRIQVLMELQADCYAGVWAYHANRTERILEPGDVQEGLAAAAAIGDDRLQSQAGQRVSPESFTHGSSAQRQRWLETGLETGNVDACDTFGEAGLHRTR